MTIVHALRAGLAVLALCLAGTPAGAQPGGPIHIIVPLPAGTSTDFAARLLAQKLGEQLGQPVVVDNRPGANGNIAADMAARSPADGYTLCIGTIGVLSINPFIYKHVDYDPVKDFAPISQLVLFSNILVVHPSLPVA